MSRKALRMLSCVLAEEDVASRGFLLGGRKREKEEQRSMSNAGWANLEIENGTRSKPI